MDDLLLISEAIRFPQRKHFWQSNWKQTYVYLFDWHTKSILKKVAVPAPSIAQKEYSSLLACYHYHGARGITSNARHVFVALQNSIVVFDKNLDAIVGRMDHRLFNGIHEMVWAEDRLYVTCAVTDAILVMSGEGRELAAFTLGNHEYLLEKFHLPARELDDCLDYRYLHSAERLYHVNNVQVLSGNIYAHFFRQGSFVRIHPRAEVIIHHKHLRQSHNGQYSPNGRFILINDSANKMLRVFDAEGNPFRQIDFRRFPLPVDFSKQERFGQSHSIHSGWLRGMAFSRKCEEIAFVGMSPTLIVALDYISGAMVDYHCFRRDFSIGVHGLHNLSLPSTFGADA
jgi:hypothetical protein